MTSSEQYAEITKQRLSKAEEAVTDEWQACKPLGQKIGIAASRVNELLNLRPDLFESTQRRPDYTSSRSDTMSTHWRRRKGITLSPQPR